MVGQGKHHIETCLRQLPGVRSVQANGLTGNILVQYDPAIIDEQAILREVQALDLNTIEAPEPEPPPPVAREKQGETVRARIAVRGLDRDPHVAKRVMDHLRRYPEVRSSVSRLTGRVLVEFTEHEIDLENLVAEISHLELPPLDEEDHPAYPLDPGPLIQSTSRTIGASAGLGLLAIRRLIGIQEPLPGANVAIQIASIIGILQGIPPFRYGLRRLLGRTMADLLVNIPSVITLTLSSSLLGLSVIAAESVRLLTEVQARRAAWHRHEERAANAPSAQPDAIIRLEASERTPLAAEVLEGTGTAIGLDGMPQPVTRGSMLAPGARLYGGPFTLKLRNEETFEAFVPQSRPARVTPSLYDHYMRFQGPFSLLYAVATGVLTRSFSRTLAALMLVNPRPALIGIDSAELGAASRALRAGVTVVGTRADRPIRLPHLVLLDGARLLTDRLEVTSVLPLTGEGDSASLLAQAAGVAAAAGSPWGGAFKATGSAPAVDGAFDGKTASASINGTRYTLGPVEDWSRLPEAARLRQRGNYVLVLRREQAKRPLGLFALRPHLAPGVTELTQACQRYGVELGVLANGDQIAVQALAHRANVSVVESDNAVDAIQARQREGKRVVFVSDQAGAAAGFDACDLAIGMTDERGHLAARADLLVPDLYALAAIIEAAARREATVRDSIGLSALSNIIGAIWGFRGAPGIATASRTVYITALAALADGWLRLRGGQRPSSSIARLVDPRPERWGRRSIESVLHALRSSEDGLTSAQASERQHQTPPQVRRNQLLAEIRTQLRSPLLGILAAGAGLSLLLGATGDVIIIGATILVNVAVGVWQEHRADQVAEALHRMETSMARVLRDKQPVTIPANEVVIGDVLLLAPGDRVVADARVLTSQGLEVDEAALTGESLPVPKMPEGGTETNRIVLEGSNVTTGTGRAVVVAVGRQTRMGATVVALSAAEERQSPLGLRLSQMLKVFIPISIAGGIIVVVAGGLWGQSLAALLATGASIALAGVPEGLPLLTRVGESGVARRLASNQAVVRRLSAIESLGRVDVACADKTGTMTQGHLVLSLVATPTSEAKLPGPLSLAIQHVLLTAALASPHPDAPDAHAHPTDIAVVCGALDAGLADQIYAPHQAELSFDPARSFHATIAGGASLHQGCAGGPSAQVYSRVNTRRATASG